MGLCKLLKAKISKSTFEKWTWEGRVSKCVSCDEDSIFGSSSISEMSVVVPAL